MFDTTASAPDHALMQDPAFARALRLCGQRPVILPGGLMVLRRRILGLPLAMLPRAAPPPDLSDQLRAVGLHRYPLILSPDAPADLPRSLRVARPRHRALLDLSGDETCRRKGLHPKWRNQLRRAERQRVAAIDGPVRPDTLDALLHLESAQSKTRGYANWPAPLTAAFARVASEQTHLLAARYRNETVAQMLFLTHGRTATYHIGHITPQGKQLCAHNLLLWRAMEYFAKRGARQIDLGLLDARTPGLNRFKERTGARVEMTGGTHLVWRP